MLINNDAATVTCPAIEERYEAQGFTFSTSMENRHFNLTLNVLASKDTNNSLIECKVVGPNYFHHAA